jgi:hypothetical protein
MHSRHRHDHWRLELMTDERAQLSAKSASAMIDAALFMKARAHAC